MKMNNNFKSKGEKKIAEFLNDIGIKYEYEFPIAIRENDGKIRIWYPDFYLTEFQIVIEFFGMMNNENYKKGTEYKQKIYFKCGIDLISIYSLDKNWKNWLKDKIKDKIDKKLINFKKRKK
jgi:hypothetical protein